MVKNSTFHFWTARYPGSPGWKPPSFFRKVGNSEWNTILWPGRGFRNIFQVWKELPFFRNGGKLADFQGLCKNFIKPFFLYKKTLESLESIRKHPNKFLKLCKKHVKSCGPFFVGIINKNFLKKVDNSKAFGNLQQTQASLLHSRASIHATMTGMKELGSPCQVAHETVLETAGSLKWSPKITGSLRTPLKLVPPGTSFNEGEKGRKILLEDVKAARNAILTSIKRHRKSEKIAMMGRRRTTTTRRTYTTNKWRYPQKVAKSRNCWVSFPSMIFHRSVTKHDACPRWLPRTSQRGGKLYRMNGHVGYRRPKEVAMLVLIYNETGEKPIIPSWSL